MYSLHQDLDEICEVLAEELKRANDKLERTRGSLSIGDIDYIDKLTHALKSVKSTKAMIDKESNTASFDSNYSRRNERTYDSRRNTMYPYSYGDRYMRDYSGDEKMLSELKELMREAPDEATRQEFEKFINKIQSM